MAIKPSPHLVVLLCMIHIAAAFVAAGASMPALARVAIIVMILLSLLYHLARDALLLLSDSWREISVEQGHVSVISGGMHLSGMLAAKSAVSPYFIVLGVKLEGRRLPVYRLILPDSLGDDSFRKLRVLLKFSQ